MKELSKDFEFIRDKIRSIAQCVESDDKISAAFMLGSLHQICHQHACDFEPINNCKQKECCK